MAETAILTESKYQKLLGDLRELMEAGKRRAQVAAARELVQTYWEVGKRISEEGLTENAGYGDSITEDLSEDLAIDVDTLRKCVIFFEQHEIQVPGDLYLSWSHYKALLPVRDDEARAFYRREASQQRWSREELRRAIDRDLYGRMNGKKKGFGQKLKRPVKPTYVYKGLVERVVDGDTLLLRIDLGFQVWKEQRVRLARIDTPPIDTGRGYEAFEYVRDQLAQAPFVVIKTNKIDIYGRYVADVFYSFTDKKIARVFEEGRYLNQELVSKGLAKAV